MKNTFIAAFLLMAGMLQAQIPEGYYEGTDGLTGYALKTKLSEITGEGYVQNSYASLWDFFSENDTDEYYEDDGTLLDIYSEDPDGPDPYNYVIINDQCGNYAEEGDCYNREHLMPKSWFGGSYPMKTDVHHIYPTDGYVNGMHGNMPFGEVDNPTFESDNGSKKGPNTYDYPGAYTGTVFEPIDEFKGDIARAYFYMATRYEDQVAGWENSNSGSQHTFNGTSDQVFNDWTLDMLLKWNAEDPVSQREIDRNNAAYNYQGNRNPFIDHPEYVGLIWGAVSTAILDEDFNDCATVSVNFTGVSEMSPLDWHCIDEHGEDNTGAMEMNAFDDGEQVPSLDWLIASTPIDFDNYTDESLSFYTAATFGDTELQLLYSTDYDGGENPSDFTWEAVPNVNIPVYPENESDEVEFTFDDIDISAIEGTSVYLAFKYDNSNGEAATRWKVDNVKLTAKEDLGTRKPEKLHISVYPNPVSNGYISIDLPEIEQYRFRIYDLSGKLIWKTTQETNHLRLSSDKFSNGLYLIKISNGRQKAVKRLIVE